MKKIDIRKYLEFNIKTLYISTLGMQLKGELEEYLSSECLSQKQKGLKFYELSILLTQLIKEQQNKPRDDKSSNSGKIRNINIIERSTKPKIKTKQANL